MPTPFLSSEEYDERAHQLYNEGQYDEALEVLREGLALYPNSVELHVGLGYARMAREEFAWARRSFDEALVLDPEHEDALAGLGEVLIKFGLRDAGVASFRKILDLGYQDDLDLMLQVGRALFREGLMLEAKSFFQVAVEQAPEMAEALACMGYAQHRLGEDEPAVASLRQALQIDNDHNEARIYLANILYDRGDYEASLYHFERSTPEDHWDELGIWRLIELKKSLYRLKDGDVELKPWEDRVSDLSGEPDATDELLAEIEQRAAEQADALEAEARQQLELFGTLLTEMVGKRVSLDEHRVEVEGLGAFAGTWEEIVRGLRDASTTFKDSSVQDFMRNEARRVHAINGVELPTRDAESFIKASADAGLLRIVQ
jgi:Flp pilus assembly protein TadD